jgi:hypothetical protein
VAGAYRCFALSGRRSTFCCTNQGVALGWLVSTFQAIGIHHRKDHRLQKLKRAAQLSVTSSDVSRFSWLLQGCGVSFLGAQQLLEGQVVTSQGDRRAIGSIISDVSTSELDRIGRTYRKIEWAVNSGKMWMDDWNTSP